MKRYLLFLAVLLVCLWALGCAHAQTQSADAPVAVTAPPAASEAPAEAIHEAGNTDVAEAVPAERLILFDTACKKLTTSEQPRYDGIVTAYSIREFVEAYEISPVEDITVIGASGYREAEPYEGFLDKYISIAAEYAPIVVGRTQDADWAIHNVAAIRIGTSAIVFFYQKDDIPVSDLFAAANMTEADSYVFTCEDGYQQAVSVAEIPECALTRIDNRFDVRIPSLGEYTLYNVLSIAPAA